VRLGQGNKGAVVTVQIAFPVNVVAKFSGSGKPRLRIGRLPRGA